MNTKAILTALAVISSVLAGPAFANDASADRDWNWRNRQTVSRTSSGASNEQGGPVSAAEPRKAADAKCGCAMHGETHAAMGH